MEYTKTNYEPKEPKEPAGKQCLWAHQVLEQQDAQQRARVESEAAMAQISGSVAEDVGEVRGTVEEADSEATAAAGEQQHPEDGAADEATLRARALDRLERALEVGHNQTREVYEVGLCGFVSGFKDMDRLRCGRPRGHRLRRHSMLPEVR